MNKKGNCVVVACQRAIDEGFLFCHARVMGQGELKGKRILHAWNEFNDFVFDFSNGHNIICRKEKYYGVAQIVEKDIVRRTPDEVRNLMLKTGTYGGWIQ